MNREIKPINPSLSLVVGLGDLASNVIADVAPMFLRGKAERAYMARFYSIRTDQPALFPWQEAAKAFAGSETRRGQRWMSRQHLDGLDAAARHGGTNSPKAMADPERVSCDPLSESGFSAAAGLKQSLEAALHDLRTHEHLLKAGLGSQPILPLAVFLLADLSQPDAALLFPLVTLVESLLSADISGRLYLLLNTTTFLPESVTREINPPAQCTKPSEDVYAASSSPIQRISQPEPGTSVPQRIQWQASEASPDGNEQAQENTAVYTNLMTLEGFLDGSDSSLRSQLASGLRIPIPPPLPASVFLFDRIKEGVWDVKDMAELQIILGNSLLVLLSGGLTQQLSEGMSNADLAESGAHYNSIGTTLLFHDPDGLVDACTHRMAGEILEREFNSESSLPPRLVEDDVNEFLGKVGLLSEWLERVCVETLFRPLHDEKGFLELHFADLEFEGLPIQEWGDAISGQEAWFGAEIFPRQQAQFEQNAGVLADEVAIRLAELVEDLPERVGLYPGGLTTAEKIIVQLRDHIQSSADMLRRENSPTAFDFDAALQTALQDLDQAIESLPQPPHLLHRLPGVFRRPVLLLFDFLFLRREHARLVDLREGSVRILERKYAHLAEVAARRLLLGLCLRLQDELQATGRALERLQKALAAARKKLVPQTCLQTPSPLFRIPACDQAAMDWAFSQMQPPPDELRLALFEQHHLMEGWKSLTARTITARLMDFCRVICQPAGQFSLEDILSHRAEDDRDCLLALLLEGATPLLRPDFDRSGSGQSFQSQFFLCANPRASTLATALMSDWQILATGDPYHVLACRVRHLIPLTALDALIHRTKRAYGPSSFPQRRMGKG